ncbi:MAG: hypothetical protein ACHQZS_01350 [Candidatus Binatales bacterium]
MAKKHRYQARMGDAIFFAQAIVANAFSKVSSAGRGGRLTIATSETLLRAEAFFRSATQSSAKK